MKRRNRKALWAGILILGMGLLAGCSGKQEETAVPAGIETAVQESGGTVVLKVNPEIAVDYDENGRVLTVTGRNEDGRKIVEGYQDYIGKECHEVVEELVGLIHEAGYFVEEVEGENRKITIEIETGSILPEEGFVDEIVTGVQAYVKDMQLNSPVVTGDQESDRDIYEYGDEAYEVAVPSETPAPDANAGENADDAALPDGNSADETPAPAPENQTPDSSGNAPAAGTTPSVTPPAAQESPYTDYQSPYTDYETPYTEASPYTDYESPYTDYETPYTEESPYTDYESPYTDYHHESDYGDSGYSHYH